MKGAFFQKGNGKKHYYSELREVLKTDYPKSQGLRLREQLSFLGLLDEFETGVTVGLVHDPIWDFPEEDLV